jgi:hypothetical protein
MIALLFTPPIIVQAAQTDPAVELCKPVLARKAGGEIATIDVNSVHSGPRGRTIEGQLTAFSRMGPAPAGTARTNHLIRFDFSYRCTIRGGRVHEARLSPLKP